MHYARQRINGSAPILFAHRYITRPVTGTSENHIVLTPEEFQLRKTGGLFALDWESHNLYYGIGREINDWMISGYHVVVNGSRQYLPVAQQFATKALELDPQLPLAHALLGEVAMAGGHLDEAIAQFEKERLRNPLDGSVYDRLGDAYTRAGDYTQAQQSLQRALLLEPNSTGPYILLGKVLLKKQDPVNAVMYLERAEAIVHAERQRIHHYDDQTIRNVATS